MSARNDTYALMQQIHARCKVLLNFEDANTLRRAQLVLHRWAELECGDGNDYASWSIRRCRIADREAGALRRIADICKRNGLHFYHQGDPRGCALYVHNEPLPDHNYTHGVAC